jgi:hypothetical protein
MIFRGPGLCHHSPVTGHVPEHRDPESPRTGKTRRFLKKRSSRRSACLFGTGVLVAILVLSGIVGANDFEGGIPLQTVNHGIVSGGLYYDAYPGFATSAYKSFTLPPHTTIEWARLYVGVYCGHMQNNYEGTATVNLDTNADGKVDELLATETMNVPYTYPGNGGTGPVLLGHGTRVTSDYIYWYDIKDRLTGNKVGVDVKTEKVSPSFDGRIKFIALIVAYNDADGDKVYYWVNQGHDPMSYLNDNGYTGETQFGTSQIAAREDQEFTATLSSLYMASEDGIYTFNGDELAGNGKPQGSYFGTEDWDITDSVTIDEDSTLQYKRASQYFKIPLALLTVSFKEQPEGTLDITSNPPGAEILLDGEETGKVTNQTLTSIAIGEHTVQAILTDNEQYREPDERTVSVRKGETTAVHFDMPQINGSIDIASDPPGAWIFLDGKNTSAQTDTLLEDVIIGDHTLVLKKDGYAEANTSIYLEEDDTVSVELLLPDQAGNTTADTGKATEPQGYTGKTLSLYRHGSVRGGLDVFDSGGYSGLLGKDMSATYPVAVNLSPNATVKDARLYVYTTWSYDADALLGKPADLTVDLEGDTLTRDVAYSDRKGNGTYDYPVETHCFTVDEDITGNQTLTFTITNAGNKPDKFAVYGVVLVIVSEDPDGKDQEYWIGEGADEVYANPEFGVDSGSAITRFAFPGTINTTEISGGDLYVVSTAASGASGDDNRISFNDRQWQDQLGAGSSGISIARLNVSAQIRPSGNTAGIGSVITNTKGDYMENRNIILVITRAGDGEAPVNLSSAVGNETSDALDESTGPADTDNMTGEALMVTGPIEETLNQSGKYYAVRVLSNPPGGMIAVDYEYCGKTTPDTVPDLAGGNHTFSVEMPGFEPVEERIFLSTNQTLTFDMDTRGTSVLSSEKVADTEKALIDQEQYGGIFVTSSPDEAGIYVDGKKTGFTTPSIIYGLRAGKHTVQVKQTTTKTDTDPIKMAVDRKDVWVDNGVITPISLMFFENPYLSEPMINSTAFNNSVFTLNGKMLEHHIPEKVKLQATQNFLTFRTGNAYISYTIFTDNATEIWVEPRPYTLSDVWVESDPPGADIYVDGFTTGRTTPYLVRNLSDLEHLIMVSKPGYYPIESTVRVADTDQVRYFVMEPYLNGRLAVMSDPSGGKIYVSGKDTGQKTPFTFQYMEVGKYTIKVTQNQTKATIEGFMVEPGIMNEVNLTLKKNK